ncbi:hypothetical protein TKK_0000715 [Trichogramma kaykai]
MDKIALKIETMPDGTNQIFAQQIMSAYSPNLRFNALGKDEYIIISDGAGLFFDKQIIANVPIIQDMSGFQGMVGDIDVHQSSTIQLTEETNIPQSIREIDTNVPTLGAELIISQGRTKIKCELFCVQCNKIMDENTIIQDAENLTCKCCHTQLLFKCNSCTNRYQQLRGLHKHIKNECSSIKRYHCAQCPFKCIKEVHLDLHMKKKHDAEFNFKCSKCGKEYDKRWCLKEHERSCEMPLNCEFCSFRTTQKQSLNYHIGAIHKLSYNIV